ncbi:MAG: hypothetical protein HOQ11_02560 [Gemmatimonadaceae bacterium]|nr:hypothetical protein [Gemmatimonadaceae bacterium]NUQ92538.1 hypothetical protein [Gemmatimonadaceae bacterium]NUR32734.1 hypothetical protein [Gemmatimonadaceae bacterium]NUS96270.1 hypothetical protein [Gemmatimonadaceae bacterium]
MAFKVELRSGAPPEQVLAAIREHLREWRESVIPRDVWRDGVLQVVGTVEPPRFRMRFDRRWYRGKGGDPLALEGVVVPDGTGGSRITARCGEPGYAVWIASIFGLLLVWDLISSGSLSWTLVLAAVVFLAIGAFNDRRVSRDDRDARYLVERLEQAVTSVDSKTAAPPVKSLNHSSGS